jgi:Zn-dependent M28 family amino/carboxypeptidase
VAGSPGAERAREYITSQLETNGIPVEEQAFTGDTPLGPVRMINLRATLPGTVAGAGRIVIAGHYDTKRFKEFEFVGANDGGSSTAFLIELGRVLKARGAQPGLPIELLFLDGEEAVIAWENDDHTYGSRHYVEAAKTAGTLKDIRALILVDMIGERDVRILRESNSTPWLTDIIWKAAKSLKRPEFVDQATPIEDDHIPFLRAGVPAVDIIDLDYPAWHTREDTLDKVSAASLQAVADVLLKALPEIDTKLSGSR